MRRSLLTLAALGFLCLVQLGCRHTAGVCDCDLEGPCEHRAPWAHVRALPAQPEQLKELPKASLEYQELGNPE